MISIYTHVNPRAKEVNGVNLVYSKKGYPIWRNFSPQDLRIREKQWELPIESLDKYTRKEY